CASSGARVRFRRALMTSATCSQRCGREHGPHLRVARLVPADARNGPDLWKEPGAIRVDGEIVAVKPLDLTVPARDDREPLRIGLDSEPIRFRQRSELLHGPLLLRQL